MGVKHKYKHRGGEAMGEHQTEANMAGGAGACCRCLLGEAGWLLTSLLHLCLTLKAAYQSEGGNDAVRRLPKLGLYRGEQHTAGR